MTYEFVKEEPSEGKFTDIVLEDGTAANPALKFENDQDTGIFRPANNTFSISTAGVERVRINNDDTTFYQRAKEQSFFNTGYYATMRDALPVIKDQQTVINTISTWVNPISVATTTLRSWNAMAYSPTLKRFVAITAGSADAVYSNDGGNNWISTTITNRTYYRAIWQNNLFVVISFTTSYSTSTDGITWTERTAFLPASNDWRDVIWLPQYNRWLICRSNNLSDKIYQNPDITTNAWTAITNQPSQFGWQSFAYSPEMNILVSVSEQTTNNVIYSSDGGLNWTAITVGGAFREVVWAKELNLFVAVGNAGTAFWSENGITWSAGSGLDGTRQYFRIQWIPELHVFIAPCDNTASPSAEIAYSFDGKVWSSINIPGNDFQFRAIAYSPQHANICLASRGESSPVSTNRERFFRIPLSNRWPTSDNVFNHAFNSIDNNGVWNFNDLKVNGDLISSKSSWRNMVGTGNPAIININLDDEHTSYFIDTSFTQSRVFNLPVLTQGQHHFIHFYMGQRATGTGGSFSIRFQQNAFYVNENQLITASVGTPFDLLMAQSTNLSFVSGSYYIHFPNFADNATIPTSAYRVPYIIRLSQANLNDNFNRLFLNGGSQTAPALTFSQPELGTNTGIFNRVNGEVNITTDNVERLRVGSTNTTLFNNLLLPNGSALTPSYSFESNTDTGMYLAGPITLALSVNGNQKISIVDGTGIDNQTTFATRISLPQANNTNPAIVFNNSQNHGIYCDTTNDILFIKTSTTVHKFETVSSEIPSQLITRSIVNNTNLSSTGGNQTLVRLDTLVYSNFIYELTGAIDVVLPTSMTSGDVGLCLRIGKNSGNHALTLKTNGTDYLNNGTGNTVALSGGSYHYVEVILVKVSAGVAYWLSHLT